MKLGFTKMHGCGNDYIYIDGFRYNIKSPGELSKKLSDRHFSVGGDGVIIIGPSDKADAFMHMYNADGARAKCAETAFAARQSSCTTTFCPIRM